MKKVFIVLSNLFLLFSISAIAQSNKIDSIGYIGIGTKTPEVLLDVKANATNQNLFRLSHPVSPSAAGFILGFGNSFGMDNGSIVGKVEYSDKVYNVFSIDRVTRSLIFDGGNVGIGFGLSNPTAVLEVNKSVNNFWTAKIKNGGGSSLGLSIEVGYGGDGVSTILQLGDANGNTRVTFKSNGNVGIGTTTPKNRLDVVGTIRATEVRVEATPWPDFVFAPDYKLRPLHEVEQFIKQHNHLPDIPSEATVEADGIGLGEMNAKLLQKIEELTLYLIELKKENESLRKDVLDLKMLEVEVEKLKQK